MTRSPSSNNLGLILLSASMLTFEITLTRLFAIQQFHHFAFVVVSLAVMGFAASGVILSLRSKSVSLPNTSWAFSASIIVSYLTIHFLPFDSFSIVSDPKQVAILALYFLATGMPFLLVGIAIGTCLSEAGEEAHRPYAANFVGSALGCVLALVLTSQFGGEATVFLSAFMGLLSGAAFSKRRSVALPLLGTATVLIPAVIYFAPQLNINLSPYKPLSIFQLFPDAKETLSEWSVSARLNVVETDSVHVFPGLSLNHIGIPPKQIGFFIDADGPIPVTNLPPDDPLAAALARHMPSGLAHTLRPAGETLIIQPGGGLEILLSLASGASKVTIASDSPLIIDALQGPYKQFSYRLLSDPRVSISPRTSRGSLSSSSSQFDIIIFALTDSYRPITSGAFSLNENYLLTVEALTDAFRRLSENGVLVLTRWLGTPPSESARAWATLVAALRESGTSDPSTHLIAYREIRTGTMLASPGEFTEQDLRSTRDFLDRNGYDPIHLPDLQLEELNRHNQLPEDTYYTLFRDLLQQPQLTLQTYEFNLHPPRDDRPYFYHFFRWGQTPEIINQLGSLWLPFGGSGYLVLLVLMGLMLSLALPLIIFPLLILERRVSIKRPGRMFGLYFGMLGAGYLLIEIPLIQEFTLLLDRPAISFAVVLFSMLLSSGLGSWFSKGISLSTVLPLLFGYIILLILAGPVISRIALDWYLLVRVLLVFVLITPAGFLMGMPFARGLVALEKVTPGAIPWAWAINGAISGIAGVLAAMISLDLGLRATMVFGLLAYMGAYVSSKDFR